MATKPASKRASQSRKPMSKKVRFEVFKRDAFTCQYCGAQAPDVILHVDHINPVAGGGDDDIMNLITSCQPCNAGKGARKLDDNSIIRKQREQLAEMNERRQQLEMMIKWREQLKSMDDEVVDQIEQLFTQITGRVLTDIGRKKVRQWLRRHKFLELCEAMEEAGASYWKDPVDDEARREQANKVFEYTPIIVSAKKRNADKPWMKDLYWCRVVIRNRHYCNEFLALRLLEEAYSAGVEIAHLKQLALESTSWSTWRETMEELTSGGAS